MTKSLLGLRSENLGGSAAGYNLRTLYACLRINQRNLRYRIQPNRYPGQIVDMLWRSCSRETQRDEHPWELQHVVIRIDSGIAKHSRGRSQRWMVCLFRDPLL
jgi:hypothetical protein